MCAIREEINDLHQLNKVSRVHRSVKEERSVVDSLFDSMVKETKAHPRGTMSGALMKVRTVPSI